MSRPATAIRRRRMANLLALTREALSNPERDFTAEPIRTGLFLLAVPMVLEMAMESVFAVVDIFWVARLGAEAIAVVGLTEAMLTIVYAVCIGFGMAVTALVSRRIGERDPEQAAVTAAQAIWVSAVLASLIGLVGAFYAADLLRLMGASAAIVEQGSGFTTVLLAGSASIFYLFVLNAIFRGAGDAAIAMRSLWLANGVNLVLDPCFIFGLGPFPEMGVTGAAVATTIGRSTGVAYQVWHLVDGSARVRIGLKTMAINVPVMLRLIRVSLGGIGQFFIATSSWLLMMRIVASFGAPAIAGFTIAIRVIEFVILPAWGLGNAAATLVGQNLGAGKPERAAESGWRATRYNVVAMLILALLFVVYAEPIVRWFTSEADVLAAGVLCLTYFGVGLPLYAAGMVLTQSINGAGDTRTPTILNLIAFWILQIPLALWLAHSLELGPRGVLIAIVIAESLLSVAAIAVFRHGRWQRTSV